MKRKFRLTRSTDFQRVRHLGKSYSHPLMVLIAYPNQGDRLRIAVAAGKTVGNAVKRNRAKRLIRSVMSSFLPFIEPGWDLIIIARKAMVGVTFEETRSALHSLLLRARLINQIHDV